MKILTFTTLWPNSRQPSHGLFVRERVLAMAERSEITVIAPVPWVPSWIGRISDRYRKYHGIERKETVGPVTVYHPRFLTFPKALKSLDGILMAVSVWVFFRRERLAWDFDLVDAHWLYPDGTAALLLARNRGTPTVVTVRGDDIRTFSRYFLRRLQLKYTLRNSAWVWTVCDDLRQWVERITPGVTRLGVSLNGVDTKKFHPRDRVECRRKLGLPEDRTILISVGRIEPAKGQHLMMESLRILSVGGDYLLVFVGPVDDGNYANKMRDCASRDGLESRIVWAGVVGHDALGDWLCSAEIFVMASENEGCPNSLLEAMACGIPVVVTPVGGIPELVREGDGCIFAERTANSLARGIAEMEERIRHRGNKARFHEGSVRTWDKVADQILGSLSDMDLGAP
jgi:glycosyltransferase involved in cell wall biosynthesis